MKVFISILILFITSINPYAIELQKPSIYKKSMNINDWYMSEKLDGIRAYWNGKELLSKNGNRIYAPMWFTHNLPSFELDGELWTKRNDFENIQSIVLDKKPSNDWHKITYNIFEVPNAIGDFQERLEKIKKWQRIHKHKNINIIKQVKCKNNKHLNLYLNELLSKKAEGIIIKDGKLRYFKGRSKSILKVKKFLDKEAKVISINYKNNTFKSLVLELTNGITFNLGNGFTKEERQNHPQIGDIITFKYYGLTKYGKPKFASFLRVRKDE